MNNKIRKLQQGDYFQWNNLSPTQWARRACDLKLYYGAN